MTGKDLIKANELSEIIKTTQEGIAELEELKLKVRDIKEKRHFDDGLYSFHVAANQDGSGKCAELTRYAGNVRLLNVILEELKKQLAEFENEFAEI